jgi:hypothetical protein
MRPGFSQVILPLAGRLGYTDVVLEGFDGNSANPSWGLQFSKNVVGDLLIQTEAMRAGMKMHGAEVTDKPSEVAANLLRKAKEIKRANPHAKVLIYGGAIHSATEIAVRDGEVLRVSDVHEPSHSFSFSERAYMAWGKRYAPVHLLSASDFPSAFGHVIEEVPDGCVTRVSHGDNQNTYVFSA